MNLLSIDGKSNPYLPVYETAPERTCNIQKKYEWGFVTCFPIAFAFTLQILITLWKRYFVPRYLAYFITYAIKAIFLIVYFVKVYKWSLFLLNFVYLYIYIYIYIYI